MALTGSDPYFPIGTDVAVLFEPAPAKRRLYAVLSARVAIGAQADPQAQAVEGALSGVAYHGFRSPDRGVCTYVARLGDLVVVTNSLAQLARLVDVQQQKQPAISCARRVPNSFALAIPWATRRNPALVFLSDATDPPLVRPQVAESPAAAGPVNWEPWKTCKPSFSTAWSPAT